MFRKGGLSQTARPTYQGGGVTAIRPRYRGGGLGGIMSGIVPRTNALAGYYNPEIRNQIPTGVPVSSLEEAYKPEGFEWWEWAKTKPQTIETPGGKILTVTGGKQRKETIPPEAITGYPEDINKVKEPVVTNGKTLGQDTGLDTGAESDLDTMKSYMKMFEEAYGADADAEKRQLYLEAARAGFGLLGEPGGDLAGAIGRQAEKGVAGAAKILGGQTAGKRQARLLGLQAALRGIDPTSLEKSVRYLMKQGYSRAQAINMSISGLATKGKTRESRITNIADVVLKSKGAPADPGVARKISEKIEASAKDYYEYSPLPENPIEGEYYYDKDGTVGQYQIKDGKPGIYEQD